MIYSHRKTLSILHNTMSILNLIIVLFYGTVILLTTRYIILSQLSRDFLDNIDYIPHHPLKVFFGSLFLYGILIFIMYGRNENVTTHKYMNIFYSIIEIIVSFALIYSIYMGYNGILFLVFCDCIFHLKDGRYSKWFMVILVIVYLISSYDVFSAMFPMVSVNDYFQVYGSNISGVFMIVKACLETINIILFISFMIVYLADEIQENEHISEELNMINQVNKELQNYAAITEKIGENNERKRLAREIHDTLGHALTGIAAGIDACLAMIEINPQATKQQLEVISKVVRQGIKDVRNSLNKLRPGALEEHSFKEAIERMIDEFSSVSDLTIELNYQLNNIDFEKNKEDILFRIIQECITNALRHGHATFVGIDIYQEMDFLYLKIQDNGAGCKNIKYGFGLTQMKERVAIINGEIYFAGDNGFLTIVKIPIQRGEKYGESSNS
ncbi:histidine kinase [Erysipelatoclostridium sp. An173]|uniref:sensor histidine kinase n=1 Tax=Erysipelatoclostridium sp. An173 TaxID=1965571 RepID=UPI000B36FD87|nr:sensor histidine kinase [Erysipelatoclostridium sp. An173]OUP78611.1 histidine kinase [Erysipelatoclostridium sp. An173]